MHPALQRSLAQRTGQSERIEHFGVTHNPRMSVRAVSLATSALRSRATLQLQARQATLGSRFARSFVHRPQHSGSLVAKPGALRRLGHILASGAAAVGIMSSAKDQYPTDALKQVMF